MAVEEDLCCCFAFSFGAFLRRSVLVLMSWCESREPSNLIISDFCIRISKLLSSVLFALRYCSGVIVAPLGFVGGRGRIWLWRKMIAFLV